MLVTLIGWTVMFLGLFRMLAPEARQGGENLPMYLMFVVLFMIGGFLTFKAFSRGDDKTAAH